MDSKKTGGELSWQNLIESLTGATSDSKVNYDEGLGGIGGSPVWSGLAVHGGAGPTYHLGTFPYTHAHSAEILHESLLRDAGLAAALGVLQDRHVNKNQSVTISDFHVFVNDIKRLSDPEHEAAVTEQIAGLAADRGLAQRFLESIGVATADGHLTKNFGG